MKTKEISVLNPEALETAKEDLLPLLLSLKEITEAQDAYGTGFSFRLPPEARWEALRDAPVEELPKRLKEALLPLEEVGSAIPTLEEGDEGFSMVRYALRRLSRHYPTLFPEEAGPFLPPRKGRRKALQEEGLALLAYLVRGVDKGEIRSARPPLPGPAARLMARLLNPGPWDRILDFPAGNGELLAAVHGQLVGKYGLLYRQGLFRTHHGRYPAGLYLGESSYARLLYPWVRLSLMGIPARAYTGIPYREIFDGVVSRLHAPSREGVLNLFNDWNWVRITMSLLWEGGRGVFLLGEERTREAAEAYYREHLVKRGFVRGAVRLDPTLFGTDGVIVILERRARDIRRIPMVETEGMKGSPGEVIIRVAKGIEGEEPIGDHGTLVPLEVIARRGYSLNPSDYA